MAKQVKLLGVAIDALSMDQVVEKIGYFIEDRGLHLVVTANPEILDEGTRNKDSMALLQEADLCTADGVGVLLGARMLGEKLPERVTGIELAERLCAESGKRGWRIYLLGSEPGVVDGAERKLREKYPDVNICGRHHGYFRNDPVMKDQVIADVAASEADILLAGLGSPYQENFIKAYQWEMKVPVGIGVGGSFDVFSGRVERAPEWVRNLRLEWLYRIASDPSRWGRALALPRFVLKIAYQRVCEAFAAYKAKN